MFGAPLAGDVALWTDGNPNAQAALVGGQALGLGSLQAGGGAVALHYAGSLALDLTNADFAGSQHLGLAFLDPTSSGGLSLLELTLTRGGETLFTRSFASDAEALAGLDDAVFDLGPLLAAGGDVTDVVLSFALDLPLGGPAGSFGMDFALLATAAPEPAVALLIGLAAITSLALRTRASHSPPI